MKKLLIDVNSIVSYYVSGRLNGIGRTTLELIQTLADMDDLPFEIQLYSQNMRGVGGHNTGLPFKCTHVYLPHRDKWNRILAKFPIRESLIKYDIMHIPHNFEYVYQPEKCVVTIHDVMFFSYPEAFLGHDFARKNYPSLAKKAKAIITCSENSKTEIVKYMHIDEDKVYVCPWGVDHNLFKPQNFYPNKYTGSKPFFLSVSCDIGRKNTISVLKAYEIFVKQQPDHELILVWRNPPVDIKDYFTKKNFHNKIHFVSDVSNEELSLLYATATVTFFPSKYEGFGLPLLESMASGTPVITCKNSSLTEIGGEAAIYVEPEDWGEMSRWMERLENKSIDVSTLRKKSLEQASKFTWKNCADRTKEVYERCLG